MGRTTRLFVYGTLRSGSAAAAARALRTHAVRVGTGSIGARLLDLGAYPGAVPSDDPADRVAGEVWTIAVGAETEILRLLDDYEGCTPKATRLFRRARTDVRCDDGRTRRAWVYYYARPIPVP
jgi:gamma-glutamylcyclotransferase (GGCT)/AIG2-like uncharacterized protein YtfP